MTENEFILSVKDKNRKLFDAKEIKIRPDSLEKLLRQAFNEGIKFNRNEKSLFEELFGKYKK